MAKRTLQLGSPKSTGYYIEPVLPRHVKKILFDETPIPPDSGLAKAVRCASTLPDPAAPLPADLDVNKERLNNLRQDGKLLALLAEQQDIKASIIDSHGMVSAAPPHRQEMYKSCAKRYSRRLTKLCDSEFKLVRAQYFDAKFRSIRPRVDPDASSESNPSSGKRKNSAQTSSSNENDGVPSLEDGPSTLNIDIDVVNHVRNPVL